MLRAGDIAVLATLPAVALAPLAALTSTPFLQPLVVWFVVVGITRVVAVLPVAREAAREARDRNLVVDEGESERARIAADIHDDVIQDLSMLVHRLDRAGEDESAATLRAAIDRLRAICGDLRLPVIHDLGLAAALEALVGEVRVASGMDIDLRYDGRERLPYDVELGSTASRRRPSPTPSNTAARPSRCASAPSLARPSSRSRTAVPALARTPWRGRPAPATSGSSPWSSAPRSSGPELAVADRPGGGTRVRVVWSAVPTSPAAEGRSGRGDVTTEPRPVRVAIVDDHPVVRDGMAALLREYPGIEIAGTAASLDLAEPLPRPSPGGRAAPGHPPRPGDRLSAPRAPSGCWAAAGRSWCSPRSGRPSTRLRHTASAPPRSCSRPRRCRSSWQPSGGGARRARRCGAGPRGHRPTLTTREQEVVRLVVEGRSNDEIGAALGIATKTVEGHLRRVFDRLGIESRAALSARAVAEGWLDVPTVARRRGPGLYAGGRHRRAMPLTRPFVRPSARLRPAVLHQWRGQ